MALVPTICLGTRHHHDVTKRGLRRCQRQGAHSFDAILVIVLITKSQKEMPTTRAAIKKSPNMDTVFKNLDMDTPCSTRSYYKLVFLERCV